MNIPKDVQSLIQQMDMSWQRMRARCEQVGQVEAFLEMLETFFEQDPQRDYPIVNDTTQPLSPKAEQCFKGFCDGVDYISKKYQTSPASVTITQEDKDVPYYNIDSGTIFVPRNFLEGIAGCSAVRSTKAENSYLDPVAAATMYGVEEAYHHYQFSRHRQQYEPHLKDMKQPGDEGYDNNPIEAAARIEVEDAIKAFRRTQPERFSAIPAGGPSKDKPQIPGR